MEKCNFIIHRCRKFEFEDLYRKKVKAFLDEHFDRYKEPSAFCPTWGYTTEKRELLIQFINGLKKLEFEKFDHDKLEYGFKKWVEPTSSETILMKEENIISYVWKGLTDTKKLSMVIYVSIGEQNGTYIVEISGCATFWTNKGGRQWKEIDLSGGFTHSPSTARDWSHSVRGVKQKKDVLKHSRAKF